MAGLLGRIWVCPSAQAGKINFVANALSRKAELAAISKVHMELLDLIKEGLKHDPLAKQLVELAKEGKTKQFWVEDGLLLTKSRRIYVLK